MGKSGKKSRSGSFKANVKEHGREQGKKHGSDGHPDENQIDFNPSDGDETSEHEIAQEMASYSVTQSDDELDMSGDEEWELPDGDYGLENPHTCCSHCQTIFEVSVDMLSSVDTRVRCGECRNIFDALANLCEVLEDEDEEEDDILIDDDGNVIDPNSLSASIKRHEQHSLTADNSYHGASSLSDASAAALAGLSNDISSLDITYADFDLFSDDADIPEIAYFDQTRDTSSFEFDDVDENDETFSDTLFAQDVTVDALAGTRATAEADELHDIALSSDVDYITDESPVEPLIFNYHERVARTSSNDASATVGTSKPNNVDRTVYGGVDRDLYSREGNSISVPDGMVGPWLMRSALLFLVLSLAGGLYFYRERESLYTNRFIRPVIASACSVLNCVLPEQSDLSAIKVLKRTVFSHPSIDNALIINLGFVNEAAFDQRYPVLEIRLTDRSGRLVVKNNFLPIDYLETWRAGDKLDAGKRLDISLTVEDPGKTATSFELDFR